MPIADNESKGKGPSSQQLVESKCSQKTKGTEMKIRKVGRMNRQEQREKGNGVSKGKNKEKG
jgi:hypothetical protein